MFAADKYTDDLMLYNLYALSSVDDIFRRFALVVLSDVALSDAAAL